jgi:alpha,alpha-trehalose-phosphate synthase [UDP-forming]
MLAASHPHTRTFIVANRLPVEYDSAAGWRPSPGGLVSALEPALSQMDAVWVGARGTLSPSPIPAPRPNYPGHSANIALVEIPMTHADVSSFYEGFCNGALWPLYHDAFVAPVFREEEFEAYCRINRRFADCVARIAPPDSLVWVHDYHLQLMPGFLKKLRPNIRIGFFLHVPFPSSTEFDAFPWAESVLDGLLGSDLVGFQTKQAADRFIAQVCKRFHATHREDVLELQTRTGSRCVAVRAFPIGPPSRQLAELSTTPRVQDAAAGIRARFNAPELMLLGVDRLDYTKGIALRIEAVADLLGSDEFRARDIQFVQVAMPSRTGLEAYKQLRLTVEHTLRIANAKLAALGLRPIHYVYEQLGVEQVVALYVAADVMLVTSIADGMNLVSKEYVACRHRGDGRLVLSNKTGAAAQLVDAWLVEPGDVADIKHGITNAIRATDDEATRRMSALRHAVFDHDATSWARSFLTDLAHTR